METLLRTYTKVFEELNALNSKLISLHRQKDTLRANHAQNISDAKRKLVEELEENTRRIAKINAFIGIAKTHSTRHVLATAAKPFNSGTLSRLSVQINSGFADDPFAAQLYTEASAQLMYLESEVSVLSQKNEQYIEALTNQHNLSIREVESKIASAKTEITTYLCSENFLRFMFYVEKDEVVFAGKSQPAVLSTNIVDSISIGTMELPFPVPSGMETFIANKSNGICNVVNATVKVPVSVSINGGQIITADYENTTESLVLKGIQNIILSIARYYGDKFSKVTFIDPIRYNASSLGCLSGLCGEGCFVDPVPVSDEAVKKKIKAIIAELNASNNTVDGSANKRLYIFHDFPQSYDGNSISLIQQLCANAEYYGISVVLTHNKSSQKQTVSDVYQYIQNGATNITINDSEGFACVDENGISRPFTWYLAPTQLPRDIEQKYINEKPVIDLGNNYINRVGLDLVAGPQKGVRKLENIPYGVDNNGNILYLDFENSNFATYICGASRSGKSTLIHTIITGILQSTHPDNVEIWLVDFGKTEFSRYVNKDIPHIRYIILDESPELVYDLVDRLTEIMLSRQNKFMGKWEKLKDVPEEKYMPELFVVIDEFSIMSNILANSATTAKEDYRIKLQTVLAKSAKLGMRFIFSSQGFTEGTRGLTEMAKDQIQQRIAMKADYNDIKSTLDLKTISERDELLMEQLPVHYALKRIPLTEQGDRLSNAHVLYIPNAGDQLPLIEKLRNKFSSEKVYDPAKFESYIYKRPMIKDGNAFEIFDEQKDLILEQLRKTSANGDDKVIAMYIGSPQRMLQIFPIEMVDGFCENSLLIAPTREKMAGASLVISAASSLKLQNVQTECWTSGKNPIYRQIANECDFTFNRSCSRIEDICERISQIKQAIENKIESNMMIFIMNYETIMMDMQYLAEEKQSEDKKNLSVFEEYGSFTREEGEADINTFLASVELDLEGAPAMDSVTTVKSSVTIQVSPKNATATSSFKVYDARNDLKYILTHGPRWGYHFVMQFDTCGDFRQTKLDESLFRHKIMFQTAKSEAIGIVNSAFAESVSNLTNHIFRYTNGIEDVSFRPYLHPGISIDGWSVEDEGAVNASDEEEDYLE